MRKISKISLVAAVAVAGFSTANAQPLEEAIKNVDVSGSVVYRYDNFGDNKIDGVRGDNANRSGKNNYKVGLNLSSKVNDYVKFNSRFLVADGNNGGFVGLNSGRDDNTAGSDANADVTLSNAYFGFTAIPNTVINIGKQGLATPYTVALDINGNEQNGTGILALSNVGPVTFGAGYFNNTNLNSSFELNSQQDSGYGVNAGKAGYFKNVAGAATWVNQVDSTLNGGSDLYVATVQGDLDFVKLEAWYAGLQDTFNTYTLAATSTLDLAENAKLGLEARYVNLKLKQAFADKLTTIADTETKNDMFRFAVDGKFSIVNARLAYTKTGKKGGITALDQDAKNTSLGWAITSNGAADANYFQAALGADILDNLNFTVHYGNIKAKEQSATVTTASFEDYKAQEVYGQLTYKMSKNLTTYLRYGTYEQKEVSSGDKEMDQTRGRIQVAYTF